MSKTTEIIETISNSGISARGKKELLKHLYGERLTVRQMVIAKCYDCMGYYSDGRGQDCKIPDCPLYPLMPYREGEKYATKKLSDEVRAKMRDRMKRKSPV